VKIKGLSDTTLKTEARVAASVTTSVLKSINARHRSRFTALYCHSELLRPPDNCKIARTTINNQTKKKRCVSQRFQAVHLLYSSFFPSHLYPRENGYIITFPPEKWLYSTCSPTEKWLYTCIRISPFHSQITPTKNLLYITFPHSFHPGRMYGGPLILPQYTCRINIRIPLTRICRDIE
jgi:hypothetical protein